MGKKLFQILPFALPFDAYFREAAKTTAKKIKQAGVREGKSKNEKRANEPHAIKDHNDRELENRRPRKANIGVSINKTTPQTPVSAKY